MSEIPTTATHASGPRAGQPVTPVPDELPVEIQVDPHTYASIEHYATARSLTDQEAAAELVAAGLHLFAATRAGYRLPDDAARRREWAAALRWARDRLAETVASYDSGDHERSHIAGRLVGWSYMVEAGQLTPWADQPEPDVAPITIGCGRCGKPRTEPSPTCPTPEAHPAAPAEPSGAARAAAGPHPDTPDRAAVDLDAIEARASVAAPSRLRTAVECIPEGQIRHGAILTDGDTIQEAVRAACQVAYKDIPALVAEVRRLRGLVSAAGRVLDAAQDLVAWDRDPDGGDGDRDDARQRLGEAVDEWVDADNPDQAGALERFGIDPAELDALDGDQPAEPSPEPEPEPPDGPTLGQALIDSEVDAELAAPEPDSGPGWDRGNVERIIEMLRVIPQGASGDGDQLRALLADRDQGWALLAEVERKWLAQAARATAAERDRDAARGELAMWRPEVDRLDRLADTDRETVTRLNRQLAEVTADRDTARQNLRQALDDWRADTDQVTAHWQQQLREYGEGAEADRVHWQTRAELAESRLDGQAWVDLTAELDQLHAEQAAHEGELGDMRAQLGAAETEVDRLRSELATARRDAAAATYDEGARCIRHIFGDNIDPEVARCLDALADSTRAGRPVPGSPQPASEGGGES